VRLNYQQVYLGKSAEEGGADQYVWVEAADGTRRRMTKEERQRPSTLPAGNRVFRADNLSSQSGPASTKFPVQFNNKVFPPPSGGWKTNAEGMNNLRSSNRLIAVGDTLSYVRYLDDFPVRPINNNWDDTVISGFADPRLYVVQTSTKVVQRCILMTTNPGDLVLDPTCGFGTTAFLAEQWGRRWITIDTSRVPLVLARQRLLTTTYLWYKLRNSAAGPAEGFIYTRRRNKKGEEVGGIVPHVTLKSIATKQASSEAVVVDRPDTDNAITRVSGPFVFEAVLPTPQPLDEAVANPPDDAPSNHIARMIEVLRRSPTLRLPSGGGVTLKNIRRPSKSLSLSAEAMVDQDASGKMVSLSAAIDAAHEKNTSGLPFSSKPVAIVFGPSNGAVTAKAVLDAAKEANVKSYSHLYVIGFLFTAEARAEIMAGEAALGLPASPVEMTYDVLMGDLLKTQRSSQIFAITGSPETEIKRLLENAEDGTPRWQVRLLGLDTFDPASVKPHHLNGDNVPMWMLNIGWNGMAFSADQVFFPRTKAWDSLRKVLHATHEDSVWEHLAGDLSAPFTAPEGTEIAVKVLDDRGNELLKIARLGA
jgi:adenine-specific DNA-methyltransferase